MNLIIKVELLAGTDIRDACYDICELAQRSSCMIESNFNGMTLFATSNSKPEDLIDEYRVWCKRKINTL